MRRDAIAKGLQQLPPTLAWLRRSFSVFYSGPLKLFFRRQDGIYIIEGAEGTVQGDPASCVYFNAGLQPAYDKLQREFPEVTCAKYLDDLLIHVPSDDGGFTRTENVTSPRCQLVSDVFGALSAPVFLSVPLSTIIALRWKHLVKTECGLRVATKWGVSSETNALPPAQHHPLPAVPGLLVTGVPVGSDLFAKGALHKLVGEGVRETYEHVFALHGDQDRHLLASNCCGNVRVQHLWQTVSPKLCGDVIAEVDNITMPAVYQALKAAPESLSNTALRQSHLPLRHGGLGYRKSADSGDAAYIGGFALATLWNFFGVERVSLPLRRRPSPGAQRPPVPR